MSQIAWREVLGRLDGAWRRFQALPLRLKGALLGLAGVFALAVVVLAVAVAGGGDDGRPGGDPGARHGRGAFALTPRPAAPTATPSPTPTPTPTPAPPGGTQPPAEPPPPGDTPSPPANTPLPAATPIAGGYRLTKVLPAAAFDRMLAFALIPGTSDQAVIATQGGKIYRLALSGGPATLYGDISGLLIRSPGTEEGLLGLAFSPTFTSDRRVYLYYSADSGCPSGYSRCSVVSRFPVGSGGINVSQETVILRVGQPHSNHNGGQILFGPDGYMYIALGDGGGGGDPEETGQDTSDLLGSIVRINANAANPQPSVWAYGFRNPWRFTFDRATGTMWAGDVGQNKWEEVDRVVAGGNYGWDCYEGLAVFEPAGCPSSGFVAPRAVYSHADGCSVTGGYVYRGSSMPELAGWYVYGDFCSGKIWAVNTAGSGAPVLLADTGLPIASFGELSSGELLVLTFASAVYRLDRK